MSSDSDGDKTDSVAVFSGRQMSGRGKATLALLFLAAFLVVVFFVPFLPATVPGGVSGTSGPALVHYNSSIGYKLFGFGLNYYDGQFYWDSLPSFP